MNLFTENFGAFSAWYKAKNDLANNVTSATYRVQHTKKCLLSIIASLLIKLVNVVDI